eukprot:g14844.t1
MNRQAAPTARPQTADRLRDASEVHRIAEQWLRLAATLSSRDGFSTKRLAKIRKKHWEGNKPIVLLGTVVRRKALFFWSLFAVHTFLDEVWPQQGYLMNLLAAAKHGILEGGAYIGGGVDFDLADVNRAAFSAHPQVLELPSRGPGAADADIFFSDLDVETLISRHGPQSHRTPPAPQNPEITCAPDETPSSPATVSPADNRNPCDLGLCPVTRPSVFLKYLVADLVNGWWWYWDTTFDILSAATARLLKLPTFPRAGDLGLPTADTVYGVLGIEPPEYIRTVVTAKVPAGVHLQEGSPELHLCPPVARQRLADLIMGCDWLDEYHFVGRGGRVVASVIAHEIFSEGAEDGAGTVVPADVPNGRGEVEIPREEGEELQGQVEEGAEKKMAAVAAGILSDFATGFQAWQAAGRPAPPDEEQLEKEGREHAERMMMWEEQEGEGPAFLFGGAMPMDPDAAGLDISEAYDFVFDVMIQSIEKDLESAAETSAKLREMDAYYAGKLEKMKIVADHGGDRAVEKTRSTTSYTGAPLPAHFSEAPVSEALESPNVKPRPYRMVKGSSEFVDLREDRTSTSTRDGLGGEDFPPLDARFKLLKPLKELHEMDLGPRTTAATIKPEAVSWETSSPPREDNSPGTSRAGKGASDRKTRKGKGEKGSSAQGGGSTGESSANPEKTKLRQIAKLQRTAELRVRRLQDELRAAARLRERGRQMLELKKGERAVSRESSANPEKTSFEEVLEWLKQEGATRAPLHERVPAEGPAATKSQKERVPDAGGGSEEDRRENKMDLDDPETTVADRETTKNGIYQLLERYEEDDIFGSLHYWMAERLSKTAFVAMLFDHACLLYGLVLGLKAMLMGKTSACSREEEDHLVSFGGGATSDDLTKRRNGGAEGGKQVSKSRIFCPMEAEEAASLFGAGPRHQSLSAALQQTPCKEMTGFPKGEEGENWTRSRFSRERLKWFMERDDVTLQQKIKTEGLLATLEKYDDVREKFAGSDLYLSPDKLDEVKQRACFAGGSVAVKVGLLEGASRGGGPRPRSDRAEHPAGEGAKEGPPEPDLIELGPAFQVLKDVFLEEELNSGALQSWASSKLHMDVFVRYRVMMGYFLIHAWFFSKSLQVLAWGLYGAMESHVGRHSLTIAILDKLAKLLLAMTMLGYGGTNLFAPQRHKSSEHCNRHPPSPAGDPSPSAYHLLTYYHLVPPSLHTGALPRNWHDEEGVLRRDLPPIHEEILQRQREVIADMRGRTGCTCKVEDFAGAAGSSQHGAKPKPAKEPCSTSSSSTASKASASTSNPPGPTAKSKAKAKYKEQNNDKACPWAGKGRCCALVRKVAAMEARLAQGEKLSGTVMGWNVFAVHRRPWAVLVLVHLVLGWYHGDAWGDIAATDVLVYALTQTFATFTRRTGWNTGIRDLLLLRDTDEARYALRRLQVLKRDLAAGHKEKGMREQHYAQMEAQRREFLRREEEHEKIEVHACLNGFMSFAVLKKTNQLWLIEQAHPNLLELAADLLDSSSRRYERAKTRAEAEIESEAKEFTRLVKQKWGPFLGRSTSGGDGEGDLDRNQGGGDGDADDFVSDHTCSSPLAESPEAAGIRLRDEARQAFAAALAAETSGGAAAASSGAGACSSSGGGASGGRGGSGAPAVASFADMIRDLHLMAKTYYKEGKALAQATNKLQNRGN